MDLSKLGYNPALAFQMEEAAEHALPARVSRVDRGRARVFIASGERTALIAHPLTMLEAHDDATLAVGDWVACVERDDQLIVQAVLPRRSAFARARHSGASARQLLAANIDVAFVVTSLDQDFSLRRIERYLALVRASGDARAVIVLNKADLHDDVSRFRDEIFSVAAGASLLVVSALRDEGLEPLRRELEGGLTGALFGSSGVGKSTLINRLLGEELLATSPVRADDDHGRHTTTARSMFVLPAGGVVIDTPGLREVGVLGDEHDLEHVFAEIAELAEACHFGDCQHLDEPGCAVRAALESGDLDERRLASFIQLRKEQQSAARRQTTHEQRAHDKAFAGHVRRSLREIDKLKGHK